MTDSSLDLIQHKIEALPDPTTRDVLSDLVLALRQINAEKRQATVSDAILRFEQRRNR